MNSPSLKSLPRFELLRNLSPRHPAKQVWLARDHLKPDLPIVAKQILIPDSLSESHEHLFCQFDHYLSLTHPNLAKCVAICPGETPSTFWLITEFIEGAPFFPGVHSISQTSFLEILAQFCSVLHYIHSRGFLHLDLHPDNVLLVPPDGNGQGWRIKLIDLAPFSTPILLAKRDLVTFNTKYSAPEVLDGQPFDPRSDLYSLGVLLYQAIVGELPPPPAGESISASSVSSDPAISVELISPSFLAPVIQKLLSRKLERRFHSSYFLLEDINSHLKGNKLAPTTTLDDVQIAASIPFISTPAFARAVAVINNWQSTKQPPSVNHLNIVGPPGSGKTRLASALALRLTTAGWRQVHISDSQTSTADIFQNCLTTDADNPASHKARDISQREFIILDNTSPRGGLPQAYKFRGNTALIISTTNTSSLRYMQDSFLATPADKCQITTSPFDEQHCQKFLNRMLFCESIPPLQKQIIFRRGLRLPGLIHDIVLDHIVENRLRKQGAYWTFPSAESCSAPLPSTAIGRMRPLLSEMPPPDLMILQLLSLSEFSLHPQYIQEVLGSDSLDPGSPIERLLSSGFASKSSAGICLGSSSIGELAQSLLSEYERRNLCQRALRALSQHLSEKPSELDASLAVYSSHLDDRRHLVNCALRAAQYFEVMSQGQQAASFYRMALSGLASSDIMTKSNILERMLSLFEKLGHQQEFSQYSAFLLELLPQQQTSKQMRLFKLLANHYSKLLDINQSIRFATKALAIARNSGLHREQADCLDIIAQNKLSLGRPFAALRIARHSIRLRMRHNLKSDTAPAIGLMAGAFYMEGDYARALNCARHAMRNSHLGRESAQLSLSFNNLGILQMEKGELTSARRSFWKCLAMSTHSRDLFGLSTAHGNLAICQFYLGDLLSMKMHSDAFTTVLEESGSHYGYQQSLLNSAEAQFIHGQVDDALNSLAIAKAESTENGDTLNELLSNLQTGSIYSNLGNHQAAFKLLDGLQQPLFRAGYRVHQATCSLGLAAIEIAMGSFTSARQRLDSVFGRLPHQHMVSELQFHIIRGRLHVSLGDLALARRDFMFAAALARRSGFRPFAFESLLSLAQCALQSGDLDEARVTLRRLVGMNLRLKYRILEPWLHVALADYAAISGNGWEEKRHLLNGRTTLLELSHNIQDPSLRNHFLNRPQSRLLLQRSEDVEEFLHSGLARPVESPISSTALESIARINEQLHGRDSLKSTLELIIDEALHLAGAERGIIFLFDPTGREELKVARNLEHRSLVVARKYTRTALRHIRDGETVYTADTLIDPQFSSAESITHHHIRSVACLPLRSRHSIIGALYLDSHRPGLSNNPSLLKSLEIFAQQAAAALERSIRYFHVAEENRRLRESTSLDRTNLIGHGAYFTRLKQLISAACTSDLPVLILGESGTGKELVARSIHESGKNRLEPFLSVDCGALPEHLVESELFGYQKGAFTGADNDKEGLFVAAKGGTLFLDEIANTSLALQAKLLRALQEREIRPLGSTVPVPFRARILTATNGDLRKEAREGRFRQDLLFRLNGLSIEIPPLRDRKGDIPLLVSHFLHKLSGRTGHRIRQVSDEALLALTRYDWRGNVRELENCIERAVVLARAGTILLDDLPEGIRCSAIVSWSEKKGEQRLIEEALRRFGGDKTHAAAYIGWTPDVLEKMPFLRAEERFGWRGEGWREAA